VRHRQIDVVDFLVERVGFHVTNLDTLHTLLHSGSTEAPQYLAPSLSRIRHLELALRLPLEAFEQIEYHVGHTTSDWIPNPLSWLRLCPALACLEQLRTLHIWIDHDGSETYTLVNERAFLSPLNALKSTLPNLTITINLPKLHPKYEKPERHYTPYTSPPRDFSITRRTRQTSHALTNRHGEWCVDYIPDFPILSCHEFDSDSEAEERTEAFERMLWERGDDVEEYVRI